MNVRWQVTDGAAGEDDYHRLEIPDDELAQCETEEERAALIEQHIFEVFTRTVGFSWEADM
jgi:hypothetical protein